MSTMQVEQEQQDSSQRMLRTSAHVKSDVITMLHCSNFSFPFSFFPKGLLWELFDWNGNRLYYISQLVRALWLVNLAGRIQLYGPLKFEADFVAKMFLDLLPSVLNFFSK